MRSRGCCSASPDRRRRRRPRGPRMTLSRELLNGPTVDAAHALRRARADDARNRVALRLGALDPGLLAAGPGLLAAAFDIRLDLTGADLLDPGGALRLEPGGSSPEINATPRVGIGYASEPW